MLICRGVLLTWSSPRITCVIAMSSRRRRRRSCTSACRRGARCTRSSSLVVADRDRALDHVVPGDDAADRVAEAQHRLHAFGHRRQRLARLGAPACRRSAASRLRAICALAQRVELLGRACSSGTPVPCAQHLREHFLVAVHPLHLVERPFVVVEAEPAHASRICVDRFLRRARDVGVLDAQDEVAAVVRARTPTRYSAVRVLPRWMKPVGDGAKRVRTRCRARPRRDVWRAHSAQAAREVGLRCRRRPRGPTATRISPCVMPAAWRCSSVRRPCEVLAGCVIGGLGVAEVGGDRADRACCR